MNEQTSSAEFAESANECKREKERSLSSSSDTCICASWTSALSAGPTVFKSLSYKVGPSIITHACLQSPCRDRAVRLTMGWLELQGVLPRTEAAELVLNHRMRVRVTGSRRHTWGSLRVPFHSHNDTYTYMDISKRFVCVVSFRYQCILQPVS